MTPWKKKNVNWISSPKVVNALCLALGCVETNVWVIIFKRKRYCLEDYFLSNLNECQKYVSKTNTQRFVTTKKEARKDAKTLHCLLIFSLWKPASSETEKSEGEKEREGGEGRRRERMRESKGRQDLRLSFCNGYIELGKKALLFKQSHYCLWLEWMASVYSVSLVNFTLLLFSNQDFTRAIHFSYTFCAMLCSHFGVSGARFAFVCVSKSNNQFGHFGAKITADK